MMKRKLKIMSAEDDIKLTSEDMFDESLDNISEDFDYIVSSLEKLSRDGNVDFALEVCGHIGQAFSQIIDEIVGSIGE